MKRSEIYSSGWIKAPDLLEQGKGDSGIDLTIKGSRLATMDDGEKQLVLSFVEDERELGLNKTNFDAIAEFSGRDDSDHWKGVRINAYVHKLDRPYKSATHGIRVRAVAGSAPARTATPSPAANMLGAPNNIEANRRAAFSALKTAYPGLTPEQLKPHWMQALNGLFPGREQRDLTAADWLTVKTTIESGYQGEDVPADPDLPF